MNNSTFKMLGLLAGVALLGTTAVNAQDKSTLDLLVKKGVITQSEADQAAKDASGVVIPKDKNARSVKVEGMIQTQFNWLSTDDKGTLPNPPATEQFILRRVYLGAVADLGNGWGGEVLMDFAGTQAATAPVAGTPQSNANIGQNLFEKVIVTKNIPDYGTAGAGYRKVNFTQEEITPSSMILPIERSVATRYFDEAYGTNASRRLGFANRHTGLYWDGNVSQVDGLYYSAALTDGEQNLNTSVGSVGGMNKLAGWGGLGYKTVVSNVNVNGGINVGYTADGNSWNSGTLINPAGATMTNITTVIPNQTNSMFGYNPYVTVNVDAFTIAAEFLGVQVDNGRISGKFPTTNPAAPTKIAATTSQANPYGFNITPSYKINDQWELVARYSYLSTNGRGTTISDVAPGAPNTFNGAGPLPNSAGTADSLYDNVWSLYFGVNYYIIGNSVKVSAGYEYDQFQDRQTVFGGTFSGSNANVSGVRARLQLLF